MNNKLTKFKRVGLLGTFLTFASVLVCFSADRVFRNLVNQLRPEFERNLSAQFGRPLLIGSYKGIRPWGFALGASEFSEGLEDLSKASVSSLKLQFAPIASILNWRPILILSPKEFKLFLNPNQNGEFWVLGPNQGGKIPKLDINLKLDNSSTIFLNSQAEIIKPKANTLIKLYEKKVSGSFSLLFADKGAVSFKGFSYFDQLNFNGRLKINDFGLQNFQPLLATKHLNFKANGKVNANIKFGYDSSRISCDGSVLVDKFSLQPKASLMSEKLIARDTAINCSNGLLEVPKTEFGYGEWNGELSAFMPIKNIKTFTFNVISSLYSLDQPDFPINFRASLPFYVNKKGFSSGDLKANVDLKTFPLSSLTSLLGTSISGNLSGKGMISGPLSALKSNLLIELDNPQISSLRLQEKWKGNFVGLPGGGGDLSMSSVVPDASGKIDATLNKDWSLKKLVVERYGGFVVVDKDENFYTWKADDFRLDRLEVAVPPEKKFKRVMGKVIGKGTFKIDPFFIDGQLTTKSYRWLGVGLKRWQLNGSYSEKRYSLNAEIFPHANGKINFEANGLIGGPLVAKAIATNIKPSWLLDTSIKISEFNFLPRLAFGTANDLNSFSIVPRKSIENQMNTLQNSLQTLNEFNNNEKNKTIVDPAMLKGSVNAVARLEGSKISDFKLDVEAAGKVWIKGARTRQVDIMPFKATFKSRSLAEQGEFVLLNIPFSILSLFFSTPSSLSGMFGITGKYYLRENSPELDAELVLRDARILKKELVLERGNIFISNSILRTDISIREASATDSITVFGDIPLNSDVPFDLKVESHGDALSFLDGLTNEVIKWNSGSIDLKLFIRGTLTEAVSNGFLVIKDGTFLLNNMLVRDIESKIFFDFNRFEVLKFEGKSSRKGVFTAQGAMPLFREVENNNEVLNVAMKSIDLRQQSFDFIISSDVQIKRSLLRPLIGGEITIDKGSISTNKRSRNRRRVIDSDDKIKLSSSRLIYKSFPEQAWDYQSDSAKPITLFLQDQESPASKILTSSFPKEFSNIGFDSLSLYLGPELSIETQPFATFNASGKVILDGPLDENLDLTGLIRLTKGRVNLFTTTFDLDKKYKNTATFTPSMGLVPFLDIKLTTRVPDVVQDVSKLESPNDFAVNSLGSVGIGGSRFVKIELVATGLADRISEVYELSSTPVLSKSQILDLIGGNSLTMLMSGGQREVLVGLLNRSFLSPALATLSDSFSENVQLSFYPAFVTNNVTRDESEDSESNNETGFSNSDSASDDLSPQQAWIAEVGMDLSEKVNFSIQATPNRTDIPPNGTITYQFHPSVGVLGSLDKEGNWQSQLQLFFRY